MSRWSFLVLSTLVACVGVQNNGNSGRSGGPVDIERPGGGADSADSGGSSDTGGSDDTGWVDTAGSDTGNWDTGGGDTGTSIPTEEFTDLGSAVGEGVVEGDTTGLTDDYLGSCGGSGYGDALFLWKAPSAGQWTFDLSGSSFDTAMAAFDIASGSEMACDDDGGESSASLLTLELARNEQVGIVVDGYSGEGYFVLSIYGG